MAESAPLPADPLPPVRQRAGALLRVAGLALTGVLVAAAAGLAGFVAASQRSGGAEAEDAHGHEHGAGPAAPAGRPRFSPQTLGNLGVEVRTLAPGDHVVTIDVPAEVEAPPESSIDVAAPVGGVVRRVDVVAGQTVAADAPVLELVRDPFPRPTLAFTDAVLKPLHDGYRTARTALRAAAADDDVARRNLERFRASVGTDAGLVPSKVGRDLENEVALKARALESARSDLLRFGLTVAQVDAAQRGEGDVPESPPVEAVLARSGLWPPAAAEVRARLPEGDRDAPYTLAVVAELAAARRLTPDLVATLAAEPRVAAAFLDLAGLVQQGATPAGLRELDARGALEPVVVVRAPAGPPAWDVLSVAVQAGRRLEAGAPVATLRDRRTVHLRAAPTASEAAVLEHALAAGEPVSAEPLAPGFGPSVPATTLLRLEGGGHGSLVAAAENAVVATREVGGRTFRTWALREGAHYVLRVPSQRLPGRFVLPSDAVVTRGADQVVLLEDGTSFRAVPVRVEHRDAEVAVVAADGAVFPGDRVVVRGAFALSLALLAAEGGGGGGAHAGHSH